MKKILIVTRSMYKNGGVESSLLNLLDEVGSMYDIDVLAFAISNDYKDKLKKKANIIETNRWLELLGKEQSYYSKKDIFYYIRFLLVIFCRFFGNSLVLKYVLNSAKIKKHYDVAISYIQAASKFALSDGNNQFVIDYILSDEKMVFIHSDYEHENFNNSYHNNLYKRFDKIVTVSENCKKKIIKCVPDLASKIYVVHNFYSIDKIKNESKLFVPNYDKNKMNFVTVARLSEEKGILRMLDVLRRLKNKKNFVWNIVGNGNQYEEIVNKINTYHLQDYVILYGEQNNPYPYILNSDLLIVCSKYEAAPMVIGEAQILNVPVLSTDTLSANEQIQNNITGLICENSENGLYDMLSNILENHSILNKISNNLSNYLNDNSKQLEEFKNII
mgnify:CR=1 FL=1